METREYNVYKFAELDDEQKQKAIDRYREYDDYPWARENADSLNAFCELFGITYSDFDYGDRNYINADTMPGFDYTEIESFTGIRLLKYLYNNYYDDLVTPKQYWAIFKDGKLEHKNAVGTNSKFRKSRISFQWDNCPLTGYCTDNDLIEPIFDFLKHPCDNTTIEDLLQSCLDNWISSCCKDYEYLSSDEAIIETIEANDYDFKEDGSID